MDFNSIIKTLTDSDSVSQLSKVTGTNSNDITNILSSALPQLLSGAQQQATSKDTAASFANALATHGQQSSKDLSAFMNNVDLDDGQKIVNHLLGKENAQKTAKNISSNSGVSAGDITKVLSAAAPLLMTLMGQQAQKEQPKAGADLSGIVGSLFGGGSSSGGVSDILSGLFK